MTDAEVREIAATGAMVATSTGVGTPVFGVFNSDGRPTHRDGKPWPAGNPAGEERGQAAGKFPVNARTLYDNGVTLAYSSDTSFDTTASLAHELGTLNLVFSPLDMVRISASIQPGSRTRERPRHARARQACGYCDPSGRRKPRPAAKCPEAQVKTEQRPVGYRRGQRTKLLDIPFNRALDR